MHIEDRITRQLSALVRVGEAAKLEVPKRLRDYRALSRLGSSVVAIEVGEIARDVLTASVGVGVYRALAGVVSTLCSDIEGEPDSSIMGGAFYSLKVQAVSEFLDLAEAMMLKLKEDHAG